MTLSTSHLVDAGNTRLVVLLITINKNPSASSLRRGRASSLMRGSALRRLSEALRLGLGGDTSSRVQRGAGSGPACPAAVYKAPSTRRTAAAPLTFGGPNWRSSSRRSVGSIARTGPQFSDGRRPAGRRSGGDPDS